MKKPASIEAFFNQEPVTSNMVSNSRANDWLTYLNGIDYIDPAELKERNLKNLLLDKNISVVLLSRICNQVNKKAKDPTYISVNEDNYLVCPICREKASIILGPTKSVPGIVYKWKFDINPYTIQCPQAHRWNHEPYTGDKIKNGSLYAGVWSDICWDGRAWVPV